MLWAVKVLNRQAAKQADKIRNAIRSSVDVGQMVADFQHQWGEGHTATPEQVRHWLLTQFKPSSDLHDVLTNLYAEGWVLGRDVALTAYSRAVISKAAPSANDLVNAAGMNWDKWKPGNRPASLLLNKPNGLSNILKRTNTVIGGINDTTLNRIGTQLANGLAAGSTAKEIASNIFNVLGDSKRSIVIARTEMNRAMSTASMDSYKEFGVEKVEWLVAEPCDICAENDGEQVVFGEAFPSGDTEPPAHPNCVCAISPVIDGADGAPDVVADGEDLSGDLFAPAATEAKNVFTPSVYEDVPLLSDLASTREQLAAQHYVTSSTNINEYLRIGTSGTRPASFLAAKDQPEMLAKSAAEHLQSLISKSVIQQDIIVSRFTTVNEFGISSLIEGGIPAQLNALKNLIGTVRNYKAFISTSALKYANGNNVVTMFSTRPIQMLIRVPAGSQIGRLGYVEEAELLLQANTNLVITNVQQTAEKIIVEAIVTGQP